MDKNLLINPFRKNKLNLELPLKVNYECQGTIEVVSKSVIEYKNMVSEISLVGQRRLCGFDITKEGESIAILKRNWIGSSYYNSEMTINYSTSFFKQNKPRSFTVKLGCHYLVNKEPLYNTQNQSYSLNFNGRVSIPSVKNFQLVHPTDNTYIILTFGKIGKDRYIMDYKYPLSAVKAFIICLAALDTKYFCD